MGGIVPYCKQVEATSCLRLERRRNKGSLLGIGRPNKAAFDIVPSVRTKQRHIGRPWLSWITHVISKDAYRTRAPKHCQSRCWRAALPLGESEVQLWNGLLARCHVVGLGTQLTDIVDQYLCRSDASGQRRSSLKVS